MSMTTAERHRMALRAAAQISFTLPVLAAATLLPGCIEDPEGEPAAISDAEVEQGGEGGEQMTDAEAPDRQWLDDGGVDEADFEVAADDAELPDAAWMDPDAEIEADMEIADAEVGDAEVEECRALIDGDWEAFTACCDQQGWPSPACDVWGPPMPSAAPLPPAQLPGMLA